MKIENGRHMRKAKQQYLCVHKVSTVSCKCAYFRKKHSKEEKTEKESGKRKRKIRWTLFNITVRRCVKIIMRIIIIIITECKSFMCEHLAARFFSVSFSSFHLCSPPFVYQLAGCICSILSSLLILRSIDGTKTAKNFSFWETPLNHG